MTRLFEVHSHGAIRLAYLLTGDRELAEDVVQDAFLKVFTRWQDLRKPSSFEAYLRRTIVNLCNSRFRRLRLERAYLEREKGAGKHYDGMPDVEGREELMTALARLPHRQREVVVLRHLEDLSEHQTADVLGCSVGAVKSAGSRGIAALRADLEEGSN